MLSWEKETCTDQANFSIANSEDLKNITITHDFLACLTYILAELS
jgi:hypothetical protein